MRSGILLPAALLAALAILSGLQPSAAAQGGPPTCGTAGPFDFDTIESGDRAAEYSLAIELAAAGEVTDSPFSVSGETVDLTFPGLEQGGREDRKPPDPDVRIPPALLKAIVWVEASWANADGTVPWGGVGPTLRSFDCGYGLGQITTGMASETGVPTAKQALIGTHPLFNLAEAARILASKWNKAPEELPIAGTGDPAALEDWYFAVWAYNGFAFINHPLNPRYDPLRKGDETSPLYHCFEPQAYSYQEDGAGYVKYAYGDYTYPERVYGCMKYPPRYYPEEESPGATPPAVGATGGTPSPAAAAADTATPALTETPAPPATATPGGSPTPTATSPATATPTPAKTRPPGPKGTRSAASAVVAGLSAELAPGQTAVVRADGECLNLRPSPGLGEEPITCLPEGTEVTILEGPVAADDYEWWRVDTPAGVGWAAGDFLEPIATPPPGTPTPSPTPGAPPVPLPPPALEGLRLWQPLEFRMPEFDHPAIAAAFDPRNFEDCQELGFAGGCPRMDFPTSIPEWGISPHGDPTPPVDPDRAADLLGDPWLKIVGPAELVMAVDPGSDSPGELIEVVNSGSGIAPFRIRTTHPWIIVRHPDDPEDRTLDASIAVGEEIEVVVQKDPRETQQGYRSLLEITLDGEEVPPGVTEGSVMIEPLLGGQPPIVIGLTAWNQDGPPVRYYRVGLPNLGRN